MKTLNVWIFSAACVFLIISTSPADSVTVDSSKGMESKTRIVPVDTKKESQGGIGLGIAVLDDFREKTFQHYMLDLEIRTQTPLPFLSAFGNVYYGWTNLGKYEERQNWAFSPKVAYHHEYILRILGVYTGLFLYRTRVTITDVDYLKSLSQEETSGKYDSDDHIGLPLGIDFNWRNIVTAQGGVVFVSKMPPQYMMSIHLMWPTR
jgi:hypothetical protein